MSDQKRGRNRRNIRLESLEDRCLLSAVKPAAVAAHRIVIPGPPVLVSGFRAVLSGSLASDPLYGGTPRAFSSYSGHGTARPFGSVLAGLTFLPGTTVPQANATGVTNGSILLITAQGGNQLRLNFTGTNAVGARGLEYWSWTGTVAGGTGRFTNATGSFSANGSVPRGHLGRFNLTLNVAFATPV